MARGSNNWPEPGRARALRGYLPPAQRGRRADRSGQFDREASRWAEAHGDADPFGLLPDRTCLEGQERLRHVDLAHVLDDRLWAERELLKAELARRIWLHERRRPLTTARGGVVVTDFAWLRDRLTHVAAEIQRRAGGARA